MRHVGLDANLRQSTFCVLDDRGRKIVTRTVKGTWPSCSSWMKCRRSASVHENTPPLTHTMPLQECHAGLHKSGEIRLPLPPFEKRRQWQPAGKPKGAKLGASPLKRTATSRHWRPNSRI